MGALAQDIRFGFRMLGKNRGVTLFAILALGIGVGANTAIFSLLYGVILSPLPFPEPERIMMVQGTWKDEIDNSFSGPDYLDMNEQNSSFEPLSAFQAMERFTLVGEGEPIALTGFSVTTDFFETMGDKPAPGRGFLPEESIAGNHHVVILSNRLWEQRYDSDPGIVGSKLVLGETPYTVVGIAAPVMGFIEDMAQLYVPFKTEDLQKHRGSHYLNVMGRLKPGVSMEQAQADLKTIAARLAVEYPDHNKHRSVEVRTLHEMLIREVRVAFFVLYCAVGLLLLIACVNVANLLLAKSNARGKEMAVRCALGAGRLRIFRQVLTESVVLGLLGGGFGVLLSMWGLDFLRLIAPKIGSVGGGEVPGLEEISLNSTVLGFTFVLSILTGLLFGLAPAWQASRLNINETLKESGRGASGASSRRRVLNLLVIAEVGLALMLLIGAGLLVKSFYQLRTDDPGFEPEGVLVVELELPDTAHYEESYNRAAFYQDVLDRIAPLPGVESVAAINIHPLSSYNTSNGFTIEGHPPLPEGEHISAQYRNVSPDYFRTLGIPLRKGRFLTEQDDGTGGHKIVVNEEFVRRFFREEEPLGQRLHMRGDVKEVVGVVGNTESRGFDVEKTRPFMFEPIDQECWSMTSVLLKTRGDPLAMADAVRREIWEVNPNQPILRIQTMNQVVQASVSVQRFCMIILCVMAGVALLLAVIGIYGVMAYSVSERTHEIGIRMALGARTADVVSLILRKGLWLTGIGLTLGWVGAFAICRLLGSMLYEMDAMDPATFAAVPLVLFGVSLLACYLPARKAAKVDPMVALRYE